jgi:hypothetical protein
MLRSLHAALTYTLLAAGSGRGAAQPDAKYLWNVGGAAAIGQGALPPAVAVDEVVLLTSYYGKMPCLNCGTAKGNKGHQWCNGGIPQLANRTAHVSKMEKDMDARVPKNYTGWIVHDWEAWVVPWALSGNGHADSGSRYAAYENASVALARSLNPQASEEELNQIAAAAYTKAGIDLLVLTVQTTKRLRPNIAGAGFYGLPHKQYWPSPELNKTQQGWNDQLLPLWKEVTASKKTPLVASFT